MGFVFKMSILGEFSHCATIRGNISICRLLSQSSLHFSSFTIQGFQKNVIMCPPPLPYFYLLGSPYGLFLQVSLMNVYKHFSSSHVHYMSNSSHNCGNFVPSQSYGVLPIEQLNFPEDLNIPPFLVSTS